MAAKAKKKSAPKKRYLLDTGEFSDKTKEIEVREGVTTVAEAWRLAGFDVPGDKTAKEVGMRLNGRVCKWTDKIEGKNPTLYRLPKGKNGRA